MSLRSPIAGFVLSVCWLSLSQELPRAMIRIAFPDAVTRGAIFIGGSVAAPRLGASAESAWLARSATSEAAWLKPVMVAAAGAGGLAGGRGRRRLPERVYRVWRCCADSGTSPCTAVGAAAPAARPEVCTNGACGPGPGHLCQRHPRAPGLLLRSERQPMQGGLRDRRPVPATGQLRHRLSPVPVQRDHLCSGQCVSNTSGTGAGLGCTPCQPPPSASATCDGASCGFTCNTGYHPCSGQCVSNSSVNSCGPSCTPCPLPANAGVTTCDATCGFTCNTGYHPCSGQCVSNSSVSTCGTRCMPCPLPANAGATTCDGASCGFTCNTGFHPCSGQCVSNSSAWTCGASCAPCQPPANATATCDGASCGFACNTGYHLCSGQCVPNSSVSTCGTSCAPCQPPANATATCDGTSCGFACNFGYRVCGGACCPNLR